MLRPGRRLPSKYKRPVQPSTRRLVERRHARVQLYRRQRWMRSVQRLRRKASAVRGKVMRYATVIVGLGVVAIVGVMLFSPLLHVRQISVRRVDTRLDVQHIQQVLAPLFGEHLFFLAPQHVRTLLSQGVPDLHDVEVLKSYPSTLEVRVTLDPLFARLQIQDPVIVAETASGSAVSDTASGAVTLRPGEDFLTENGIYVRYPGSLVTQGSGLLLMQIVDWGVRPVPGSAIVTPQMLEAMQQTEADLLAGFGQTVDRREVFVRAREFHLHLAEGYTLWLDMQSSVEQQLSRYRTLLQAVDRAAIAEYVDLRLTDKIVYK